MWPETWGEGSARARWKQCGHCHPRAVPPQRAGVAGRLHGAQGTGLCSDLRGTHTLSFSADATHGGHRDWALLCGTLGNWEDK